MSNRICSLDNPWDDYFFTYNFLYYLGLARLMMAELSIEVLQWVEGEAKKREIEPSTFLDSILWAAQKEFNEKNIYLTGKTACLTCRFWRQNDTEDKDHGKCVHYKMHDMLKAKNDHCVHYEKAEGEE